MLWAHLCFHCSICPDLPLFPMAPMVHYPTQALPSPSSQVFMHHCHLYHPTAITHHFVALSCYNVKLHEIYRPLTPLYYSPPGGRETTTGYITWQGNYQAVPCPAECQKFLRQANVGTNSEHTKGKLQNVTLFRIVINQH